MLHALDKSDVMMRFPSGEDMVNCNCVRPNIGDLSGRKPPKRLNRASGLENEWLAAVLKLMCLFRRSTIPEFPNRVHKPSNLVWQAPKCITRCHSENTFYTIKASFQEEILDTYLSSSFCGITDSCRVVQLQFLRL